MGYHGSDGVPGSGAEEAVLVLLVAEPAIEAVLVEGVAALPLGDGTGDVGVRQQDAVVTDLLQRLLADAAAQQHRIAHPARHCVPLGHREHLLVSLHRERILLLWQQKESR
jgi:hypothetical protein